MFPESFTFSIADWVNGWVDSLVTNYGDVFRHISDTLLWAIVNLEGLLRAAPWWLMLAIVGVVAWHATRKVVTTAVIVGLLFLVGAVGQLTQVVAGWKRLVCSCRVRTPSPGNVAGIGSLTVTT